MPGVPRLGGMPGKNRLYQAETSATRQFVIRSAANDLIVTGNYATRGYNSLQNPIFIKIVILSEAKNLVF
jgi:hypothetical protein